MWHPLILSTYRTCPKYTCGLYQELTKRNHKQEETGVVSGWSHLAIVHPLHGPAGGQAGAGDALVAGQPPGHHLRHGLGQWGDTGGGIRGKLGGKGNYGGECVEGKREIEFGDTCGSKSKNRGFS